MVVKRAIAWLLSIVMVLGVLIYASPVTSYADDAPIEIRTVADLYAVNNNPSGNYILMNDLDLTEATTDPDSKYNYYGMGWKALNAFSGTFDGNGKTINGLTINWTSTGGALGLFETNRGTISNLNLTNVIINCSEKVSSIGAIAGYNYGRINNCHVLSGSMNVKADYVGGIIGESHSRSDTEVGINLCSNHMIITASDSEAIGGIVGYMITNYPQSSRASYCYNAGDIHVISNGTSSINAGGIAGKGLDGIYTNAYGAMYSYCYVGQSYNCGNIYFDGESDITEVFGGVGGGGEEERSTIYCDQCYNLGSFIQSGSDDSLTIRPIGSAGSYDNCYYLRDVFGAQSNAIGLTLAQFQDIDFMPKLDFKSTWILDTNAAYPYPQLRNNIQDLTNRIDIMELVSTPTKLEYRTGDTISTDGGVLHVYFIDGTEQDIPITEDMLSGYDMSTPGVQTVTITYKGHTASYKISVTQRPDIANVELYSGPDRTTFIRGTEFDFTGAVAHVTYVDGTSEDINITAENTTGGNINQSGDYTITFTYEGYTLTFDVKVVPLSITSISVMTLPEKTTYIEGQEIDPTGLSVVGVFNSGATKPLNSDEYTLSYDRSVGPQTVTVNYQNKTATFDILYLEKSITDLAVTQLPNKTQYVQGQPLDTTGMIVTATYNDGSTSEVTGYEVGAMSDAMGFQTINVTYGGMTTHFEVYVTQRKLASLEITNLPDKTVYYSGDTFDPTGMVVSAYYNDGTQEVVTDYAMTSLSTEAGERTVTVAYQGLTAVIPVTVLENNATAIAVTMPNKTSYIQGEAFDPTGMVVTVTYENGAVEETYDYDVTGFGAAEEDNLITVSYEGVSYSFIVTIHVPVKNWKVEKAATCTSEGVEVLLCKHCGEVLETRTTAKLEHTPGDWVVEQEASYTAKGLKTRRCTICHEILESEEIPIIPTPVGAVTLDKPSMTLTIGQEGQITANVQPVNAQYGALSWTRSDTAVATVDENGKVTALSAGTAVITVKVDDTAITADCAVTVKEEASAADVLRLSGNNRYGTSLAIANQLKKQLGVSKFDSIVLATGNEYPDALAGGYLASLKNAPLILIRAQSATSHKDNKMVASWIKNNLKSGGTIYVLGSTAAISNAHVNAVKSGFKVTRLGGKNRFGTDVEILKACGVKSGKKTFLVTTGYDYHDALCASALSYPLLIVNTKKNILTADQKTYLNNLKGSTFYIIGPTSVVSGDIEKALKSYGTVKRVSTNSNAITRSVQTAQQFAPDAKAVGMAISTAFADGLCGGALINKVGAPLVLVESGEAAVVSYAADQQITSAYVFGSAKGAVSDSAVRKVFPTLSEIREVSY